MFGYVYQLTEISVGHLNFPEKNWTSSTARPKYCVCMHTELDNVNYNSFWINSNFQLRFLSVCKQSKKPFYSEKIGILIMNSKFGFILSKNCREVSTTKGAVVIERRHCSGADCAINFTIDPKNKTKAQCVFSAQLL